MVEKVDKKDVVIDVAVPSDSNIRKKEHGKEMPGSERTVVCRVKTTVVHVVIGTLGAVTPKLKEWLQHFQE